MKVCVYIHPHYETSRDLSGCVAAEFRCITVYHHFFLNLAIFCSSSKCITTINFDELHLIKNEII